jgi:hypothetical protein
MVARLGSRSWQLWRGVAGRRPVQALFSDPPSPFDTEGSPECCDIRRGGIVYLLGVLLGTGPKEACADSRDEGYDSESRDRDQDGHDYLPPF